MHKLEDFIKKNSETKKSKPDQLSQKQALTICYIVFSSTYNDPFPIQDLMKGEFNQNFVGKDNKPSAEFNRYPFYPTLQEAINNSSRLGAKPGSVYILEMGGSVEQVCSAAAQGKFSQLIVKAFSRHDLMTQEQPTAIINQHFNPQELQKHTSDCSLTSLIQSSDSPLHTKKPSQNEEYSTSQPIATLPNVKDLTNK